MTGNCINASGATIETVEDFCYLVLSSTGNCGKKSGYELKKSVSRLFKAIQNSLWKSKKIRWVKTRLYEALVLSTFLYSAKLWPVSVTQMKKLEAAHHRWQRSIWAFPERTRWQNEKVREATGRHYQMQTTEVPRTSFTHGMSQDPTTSSSLGTWWFQEKAWTPTSKLEGSHQQGSQEDRNQMGRGTGGSGHEELVESCRPMLLWK